MGEIKINAEVAENLKRQHVKHELMDMTYYKSRQDWLEEKIARLDHKLSGAIPGFRFGQGGMSSVYAKDSWITTALAEQEELQEEKADVDKRLGNIYDMLGYLDTEQYAAVYTYVCLHSCTDAEGCVEQLELRNTKALYRIIETSISVICENV